MKTIAVIMVILLCGISAGYEVGDHVYIVLDAFGFVKGTLEGNITSIDEPFICINCTSLIDHDGIAEDVPPSEVCTAKNKIYMIRTV